MEFECPDPFPDLRGCPPGLKVDAAFCFLGFICLHVQTAYHGPYLVFYYHGTYQCWNFASPCTLEGFQEFRDGLKRLAADPQYGPEYIKQYFLDHAFRRAESPHSAGINGTYGVP